MPVVSFQPKSSDFYSVSWKLVLFWSAYIGPSSHQEETCVMGKNSLLKLRWAKRGVGEKFAVTPDSVWQLGKLASTSFSVTDPAHSRRFPWFLPRFSQWPPTHPICEPTNGPRNEAKTAAPPPELTRSKSSHALGVNMSLEENVNESGEERARQLLMIFSWIQA